MPGVETNRRILRDYGVAAGAAVIIALAIRFFVVEAYRIPTSAMHPSLEPGDTIFVTKRPVGFDDSQVALGDVVVFANPREPDRDYIKRVLGLAGDTVEVKKGRMILNGAPLASPDERPPARPDDSCGREKLPSGRSYGVCWEPPLNEDYGPQEVPSGSVFVLGDLRSLGPADAKKRRTWGIVPLAAVKGRARWIWLSVDPRNPVMSALRFPSFRFDRMFRRIE